jgi:hypothetical protein
MEEKEEHERAQEPPPIDPCDLCCEMAGEVRDIISWLAHPEAHPEQLARAVIEFERRKLARFGFYLSGAISAGSIVHFSLRHADTGELCASMDVDPYTGAVEIQPACG